MSGMERIYLIDQILAGRNAVPRDELLQKLGVSLATLKRDLAYMKDRLHAPIVFDRDLGGYRFERDGKRVGPQYELPGLWFSAEEIHALLTMQHLLANLDSSVDSALIFNSYMTDLELLQAINQEFGISMEGMEPGKKNCIDALNKFLLGNFAAGRNAIVLIDEAQNLSNEALEQIRMLSNLETEKEKLLQIILVGQPELEDKLASPALRQLNERITVRFELRHLAEADVKTYIEHRLGIAGNSGNVRFSDSACRRIYRHTAGNPRKINAVSDRALLIAFTKYSSQAFSIEKDEINSAICDLAGRGEERRLVRRPALVGLIVLLAAIAITASLMYGSYLMQIIGHF